MKNYIFYTSEGFTQDNKNNDTNNCQVIGWGAGVNENAAFKNLLIECPYLKEHYFDEIMCQELESDKVYDFSITCKI